MPYYIVYFKWFINQRSDLILDHLHPLAPERGDDMRDVHHLLTHLREVTILGMSTTCSLWACSRAMSTVMNVPVRPTPALDGDQGG